MNNQLEGKPGELRFTVAITRKETGKVETYELIGTPVVEKEQEHGSDSLDGCTQRSN